jgi:hypothetical protein
MSYQLRAISSLINIQQTTDEGQLTLIQPAKIKRGFAVHSKNEPNKP